MLFRLKPLVAGRLNLTPEACSSFSLAYISDRAERLLRHAEFHDRLWMQKNKSSETDFPLLSQVDAWTLAMFELTKQFSVAYAMRCIATTLNSSDSGLSSTKVGSEER